MNTSRGGNWICRVKPTVREVKWVKNIYLESHEFLRHRLKTEGVSLKRVRNRALSVALKNQTVIHVSSQYVA